MNGKNREIGNDKDQNIKDADDQGSKSYYRVKLVHSSETQISAWRPGELAVDDEVVVQSRYGKDLGRILGEVCHRHITDKKKITDIIRVATPKDRSTFEKNLAREAEALEICREKIREFGLDMKLVSAHFLPEESKVLFFFTADERVDFRGLVKDLVTVFKMRIELRQIGVRDESRVLGGLAVCGRAYCCHGITDKLSPVSIRMAKDQNLSLNSMKISGPCGRLLCCLSYEYDFYREEKSKLPQEGSRVKLENTLYKVQEVNILTKRVRLSSQEGRIKDLPFCRFILDKNTERWTVVAESEDVEPG